MKVTKESHKFPFSFEWAATNAVYVNPIALRLIRLKNTELRQFMYTIL